MKNTITFIVITLLAFNLAACQQETPTPEAAPAPVVEEGPTAAEATMQDGVQVINISVGLKGYQPQAISLKAGVPARLVFHRTTTSHCLKAVQIPDFGVETTELPLNEDVTIEFTPGEAGSFEFACWMDMQKGAILVKS